MPVWIRPDKRSRRTIMSVHTLSASYFSGRLAIMKRRRTKLAAVLVATGLAITLSAAATPEPTRDPSKTKYVAGSEEVVAAAISQFTTYTECSSPDPSDTSGVMRFYVTWLRDTTPNPDKVRPIAFVLQNGFNHTVGVNSIVHYSRAGVQNWFTNNDNGFVLTTPNAQGQQQAGNFWNSAGGQNNQEAVGSLPARPLNSSDRTGNKWTVHRPQWNGNASAYGNSDASRVDTYSPYNSPWWTELRNDGPYFLAYYYVQGDYSTCAGWYPP